MKGVTVLTHIMIIVHAADASQDAKYAQLVYPIPASFEYLSALESIEI